MHPMRSLVLAALLMTQLAFTSPIDQELAFELTDGHHDSTALAGGELSLTGGATRGTWTTSEETPAIRFRQAVLTWNATTPRGATLRVEVRGRRQGQWSQWYLVANWRGAAATEPAPRPDDGPAGADPSGVKLDVDTLLAEPPGADALQCRFTFLPGPDGKAPSLRRAMAVVSGDRADLGPEDTSAPKGPAIELKVPFRSQKWERKEIASRICCPTSVSMAMHHFGVERASEEVALRCYDERSNLFGNWSFAAAAASEYGFDARVTRLRGWAPVRAFIERGVPVIISISFGPNELSGSPMEKGTKGHLILVRGFSADGKVLVNDPAGGSVKAGRVAYRADELLKAWRNGVAIVVEPRRRS